jgi:hypothetical protein
MIASAFSASIGIIKLYKYSYIHKLTFRLTYETKFMWL